MPREMIVRVSNVRCVEAPPVTGPRGNDGSDTDLHTEWPIFIIIIYITAKMSSIWAKGCMLIVFVLSDLT